MHDTLFKNRNNSIRSPEGQPVERRMTSETAIVIIFCKGRMILFIVGLRQTNRDKQEEARLVRLSVSIKSYCLRRRGGMLFHTILHYYGSHGISLTSHIVGRER
jgi:hypothetical protein